jgi:hypothetical protein
MANWCANKRKIIFSLAEQTKRWPKKSWILSETWQKYVEKRKKMIIALSNHIWYIRDTAFARSVSGEGKGARKCRFYVLRANVV